MALHSGNQNQSDRRRCTDHDITVLVIKVLGWSGGWLAFCLGVGFFVSVYLAHTTGKEPIPGLAMALVTGLVGAMGSNFGNIGSMLANAIGSSNNNRNQAREIGQGLVDAAERNDGLPVKPADPENAPEVAPVAQEATQEAPAEKPTENEVAETETTETGAKD